MAVSVAARSAWTRRSPSRSGLPSGFRERLGRIRPARHAAVHVRQRVGHVVGDDKAVAGKLDRRLEDFGQRKIAGAEFFQRQRQARHRAGHADAERGIARFGIIRLAIGAEEDIARHRGRTGLAIVDRDVLAALGGMDHHETAAADIAGARIGDRQRKAGCDRGIHRIAAPAQDVGADLRGDLLLRHHHAVFCGDGLHGIERRRRVKTALLRVGRRDDKEKAAAPATISASPGQVRGHQAPVQQNRGARVRQR